MVSLRASIISLAASLIFALALSPASTLLGCRRDAERERSSPEVARLLRGEVEPRFPSSAQLHERSGRGVVSYLGFDVEPNTVRPGDVVTMTHYFRVERAMAGDYDVFVHGEAAEGGGRVLVADHAPILGRLPTHAWKVGELWADPHRVKIPASLPSAGIEMLVGMFKGDMRLVVEAPPGKNDGRDRIRAGVVAIEGALDDLPSVTIARLVAGEAVRADGRLDEPAWARAPVLSFSDSMGRSTGPRFPTKLRLLYDEAHLYVAFECVDADITERYSRRDDPIYEHESVEVFLMPGAVAPATAPYVELQASPGGVVFDAAFVARRQGMDKSFDAGQEVGTTIDGTLNELDEDRGWISEWVVPWAKVRGVGQPPRPGEEWRMNAFRIDKSRVDGTEGSEYTAWSPPRVGDFHNVARFGRMKFGP